ncbi:MAG: SMP-30/gluconolactonase/LRE family protein [Anaerolineales bacterium]|nr:SMP-30/gluconolactonase/LRE family protein [Anaerolineales bacterium]
MTNDAELVLAAGDELGEGPVWHSEEQALYWVDIDGRRYHRLEPSTERHDIFNVGEMIGALALYRHGSVVLATERGFSFYDPSQNTLTPIGDPEADKPESRFNDGAVDRAGRFWAGTLGDGNNNSLYRLDPSGVIRRMDTGIAISNGIGWSLDNRTMYFVDSLPAVIYAYDFDLAGGEIAQRRVFVDRSGQPGLPDGLTVDAEGFIWVAIWEGACLERYDPAGTLERRLPMPVAYPTSMAFGGADLSDLYVTSALCEIPAAERPTAPLAGGLFRIPGAGRGLPEPRFAS